MDYTTTVNPADLDPTTQGFLAGLSLVYIIVGILASIFLIIATWIIYKKAGEKGWACIIPIYNLIVLFRIVKMDWWHILIFLFVPFAAIVYGILLDFKLAKVFGKGVGFGFLLLLIPIIGYPVLAFGSAKYEG